MSESTREEPSSSLGILVVVAVAVLTGAALLLAVTPRRLRAAECPVPVPLVPLDRDDFAYDSLTVLNPSMNPSHQFFRQWHLAKADHGAVSFECCAPRGGLVVYLVDNPNDATLKDSKGYAVVFDNQRSTHETYVSRVPGFPSKHPRTRTNKGFTMNADPNACTKYWIVYTRGTVLVGTGGEPGSADSKLITCMQGDDDVAPAGVYWIGFGSLSQDTSGMTIKNIRTFDAPNEGCEWSAMVPQRCSSLDPQVG